MMKAHTIRFAAAGLLLAGSGGLQGQTAGTGTPLGGQLGFQVSDYHYEEPMLGVTLDGIQFGVNGSFAHRLGESGFGRVEGRLSYGTVDYVGSGTAEDEPNLIFETRYLIGRDIASTNSAAGVSPFIGLGYRYLYNDGRGFTSTGAVGYRRYSYYLYLPVGLTARFALASGTVVAPTIEYDRFIRGRQYSALSDTGLGYIDADNTQRKGRGYRAELRFDTGRYSFAPWVQVWKIKDSDQVRISAFEVGYEPANETLEAGVEWRRRF